MASNLPSTLELGEINAALVRIARLGADCRPVGGADSGWVTVALSTMTATPDIEEGTRYEPKNAAGQTFYTYANPDRIKRYNLTGEFLAMDDEAKELLFGGSTIEGDAGSFSPGNVIGYAVPDYSDQANNGVYLEVIVQQIARGAGDCVSASGDFAPYKGFIFGKARLAPGERTFEEAPGVFTFQGTSTSNPSLYDGPWDDWPGVGYIPTSPLITVGYSQDEFDAMLATAGAGYQTLPTGS